MSALPTFLQKVTLDSNVLTIEVKQKIKPETQNNNKGKHRQETKTDLDKTT